MIRGDGEHFVKEYDYMSMCTNVLFIIIMLILVSQLPRPFSCGPRASYALKGSRSGQVNSKCHAASGPPGPSATIFVAVDAPTGPIMATTDGLPLLQVDPQYFSILYNFRVILTVIGSRLLNKHRI